MAIIRSGDDGTLLKVDAASKAARTVLYDALGNPIDVNHPLAVYLTAPVGGVVVSDGGGSLTVDGTVSVGNFPATQPVSGTVAVSNQPTTIDPTDRAARLLGHVTVDAIPEVEVKNDSGNPLAVSDGGGTLTVDDGGGSLTVDGSVTSDVSDRSSRLLGHVAVDNLPATQPVSGSVTSDVSDRGGRLLGHVQVDNLPATQPVSGTVAVSNLPGTQPVSGTVAVNNLPATQQVAGSVNVGNFPGSQAVTDGGGTLTVDDGGSSLTVDGNVSVSNFPANQPVTIAADQTALAYDAHGILPLEAVPTTLVDGTVYWAVRNTGTKRMFIGKIEMNLGFSGTAGASRSMFRFERFSAATPSGGTALTPVKKQNASAGLSGVDARFAPAGLTVAGITFETAFYRVGIANQLAVGPAPDLDFSSGPESNRLVLAPGEGLAIRAYGAVVLGAFMLGQITWAEKA